MRSIRKYIQRPIPRDVHAQLMNTCAEAHRTANTYTGARAEVTITVRNERNPNGLVATADEHGAITVERSINLGWARRNGYGA